MKKSWKRILALAAILALALCVLSSCGDDSQAKIDSAVKEAEEKAAAAKEELEGKVSELEGKLAEAEESAKTAVEEATKAAEEAAAAAKEELEGQVADLTAKLAEAEEAGKTAAEEATKAAEEAAAAAREELEGQVTDLTAKLAEAEEAGKAAVEEATKAAEEAAAAAKEELEGKVAELEGKAAELESKLAEAEEAGKTAVEEATKAAEEAAAAAKAEVEAKLEETEGKLIEAETKVAEAEARIAELETELEDAKMVLMDHKAYEAAELDTKVYVETYVQATQSWWDDKITIYAQSEDGAYFIYNAACSEEDSKKLVPGTKIRVKGFKSEWSGEVEITDATIEIVEGETWTAEAFDATKLLGKDELIDHQNELVAFKGLTVEAQDDGAAFNYKNAENKTDDLYLKVSLDGETYNFCVEFYLCGNDTDVYKAVEGLKVGDVIDVEGYLYWYNGANPHLIKVEKAAKTTKK